MENEINGTMEITTRIGCPMLCKYCPQMLLVNRYFESNSQDNQIMTFDTFKECLDKIPKNIRIDFSGMAEPFLNENTIDMVNYANEQGYNIAIYTTGFGISKCIWDQICKIGPIIIMFHLPDKTKNANIPLTEEYIETMHYIYDHSTNNTSFMSMGEPHDSIKFIEGIDIKKMHSRAGNIAREDVITADFSGKIKCKSSDNLNHNVLLPNGDVLLCCMDYGMDHVLGNLLKSSYENLFLRNEYYEIKNSMLCANNKDIICRKCTNATNF